MLKKTLSAKLTGFQIIVFTDITSILLTGNTCDIIIFIKHSTLRAVFITFVIRNEKNVLNLFTSQTFISSLNTATARRLTRFALIIDFNLTLRALTIGTNKCNENRYEYLFESTHFKLIIYLNYYQ